MKVLCLHCHCSVVSLYEIVVSQLQPYDPETPLNSTLGCLHLLTLPSFDDSLYYKVCKVSEPGILSYFIFKIYLCIYFTAWPQLPLTPLLPIPPHSSPLPLPSTPPM